MIIESTTYFEKRDRNCQIGYFYIYNWDEMDINPPFISVDNDYLVDTLYVENIHEYEKPETVANFYGLERIGFWRIKYKK